MKLLIVLASVFLVASALTEEQQWQQFKQKYNRVYKSKLEEQQRFTIFKDNLRYIEGHNVKYNSGESSYFLVVNKFADLTREEFKKTYLNYKPSTSTLPREIFEGAADPSAVPDSIDWRDSGAVLEVKDQGQCGSCWAFSTTGALEGQNYIQHKKKISLSEQELVDCTTDYGNAGCNGGWMDTAFEYVHDHGLSSEEHYAYTGEDGTCKNKTTSRTGVKVKSFTDIKQSETALKEAVGTIGPVSVAMYADFIEFYGGGIFDMFLCGDIWGLDHGVLAVGYGTEDKDFWIVKNSWGADWGEEGYFRLIRNKYDSCGIADAASYPTIH